MTPRRDTTELLAAILRAIDGHLRAGAIERARHVMAALATLRDEVLRMSPEELRVLGARLQAAVEARRDEIAGLS